MKIEKKDALTVLLTVFAALLPWQTRFIFASHGILAGMTEYGLMSVYATELLFVIGLIVCYAWLGLPKLPKENQTPARRAWMLIAAVAISLLFASHLDVAATQFVHVFCALLFFLALLDPRVRYRPVVVGFCLGLLPSVAIGFWQVIIGSSPASTILGLASRDAAHAGDAVIVVHGERILRAYGTFSHPNVFGGYLATGVVGAFWLWLTEKTKKTKCWFAVLLVTLFIGLISTLSRSAVLGLALGSGLALLVEKWKNTAAARIAVIPIAVAVIGGALVLTLFVPGLAADTRGGGATETRSIDERIAQYGDFFGLETHATFAHMLFGHGVGDYVFTLANDFPGRSVFDYQPIHSVPLLILEEVGLFGALAAIYWASCIDKMNFARFPNRDAVAAFAMGNVILVILFFDHYLWSSWAGLAMLAFIMALTVRMGEPEPHT